MDENKKRDILFIIIICAFICLMINCFCFFAIYLPVVFDGEVPGLSAVLTQCLGLSVDVQLMIFLVLMILFFIISGICRNNYYSIQEKTETKKEDEK